METQKVEAGKIQSTGLTLRKLTKWKVCLLRCFYFFPDFLKLTFQL